MKSAAYIDPPAIPVLFIQAIPPGDAGDKTLESAGLGRARSWQKFRRGREVVPHRGTQLHVKHIGPEHGAAFGQIVAAAFDLGEVATPWLARLPGRNGWHIFMSFDGDTPAGTGALFVQGSRAWCDWGATSSEFRQRGSQSAVLAARLRHAIDLGCEEIFTCTREAVPGDPQHSYSNIEKMGFEKLALRRNFQPV